jgi:hypothetical protein
MIRLLSIGLLAGLCGCLSTGEPVDAMTVEGFRASAERNGTLATLDFTVPPNFVMILYGPGENDLQVHTTKADVPNAKRIYRYIGSKPVDDDGDRFVRHDYECGDFKVFVLSDIESLSPVAMKAMRIDELPFCVVQFKNPRGNFPFPLQRSEHSTVDEKPDSDA